MKGRRTVGVVLFLGAAVALLGPPSLNAQTPAVVQLWPMLTRPSFDPNQVATLENVRLERDVATLVFAGGRLALTQPVRLMEGREARVFAAAFKGQGRLRLEPRLPLEIQQLRFHSKQAPLEAEFTEALLVFTDNTLDELRRQANFQSGDVADLQSLYWDRNADLIRWGLNWEPPVLKSLGSDRPERYALFVAELKTRSHGWLTLIVDDADPEQVELARFDSSRNIRSVWAKFPKGGKTPQEAFEDPLAHHDYRIERYTLDVTVPPSAELVGDAQVELLLRRGGERVLLFVLDPNLRVSEVTDGAGRPLTVFQPEEPKDRFFLGNYLVVLAPEPFPMGRQTLRFRYSGKRIVREEGAGTFFCQSFGWYPTYGVGRYSLTTNEFAARTEFDLTLRVPKRYSAVAVGAKVEEREEEKFRVTRWQSDLPLAVAGFAFGDYKVETQAVGNTQVEVYANRSPDDLLKGIQLQAEGALPERVGDDPRPPSGVVLGSLSPGQLAKEMVVEVGNSLRVFEKYFGPYPYKKLAVANIPTQYSYGQGWPTLLYLWAISFMDSTQRHQLGIRDHIWLTDFFRAHETSHQWWGHIVGWKSYHDQWLSEGFAEFSGILYTQFRRDIDEYRRLLRNNRVALLTRDSEGALPDSIGPIYAGLRLISAEHPGTYSTVVYKKGGWVLHMLRMLFFDLRNPQEPDHRFIAMMQDFTRTYHNQPASTEDFKAIVEKHMTPAMDFDGSRTMDWFFDSWVYGTGIPEYTMSYSIEPGADAGKFILRGSVRQAGVPEGFRALLPLYFHQGNNKMRAGWIKVAGPLTNFEIPLGFKPDKVTINDNEDVLCLVK